MPLTNEKSGKGESSIAHATSMPAVGDTVYFGRYPQSLIGTTQPSTGTEGVDWVRQTVQNGDPSVFGDPEVGTTAYYRIEQIAWRVLSNSDGKLFLMARWGLDSKPYHIDKNKPVTWGQSTIRSWLNGYGASSNKGGVSGTDYTSDNFINRAFTTSEKNVILSTSVSDEGNSTSNKIFLLSRGEKRNAFNETTLYIQNTAYTRARGGVTDRDVAAQYSGLWWLRSLNPVSTVKAVFLFGFGYEYSTGFPLNTEGVAVCPALNIKLDSIPVSSESTGIWSAQMSDSPNVPKGDIDTKFQTPPSAPTLASKNTNSITLTTVPGAEYTKNHSDYAEWQSSPVFNGLSPGTSYTFNQRFVAKDGYIASRASASISVRTDHISQSAPPAPTLASKTSNSVTLNTVLGAEYSRDGATWQSSSVFNALPSGAIYTFYQRLAAKTGYEVSPKSAGLNVMTDNLPQSAPSTPTFASKNSNSVTLNAVSGAEYSKDGLTWQSSAVFSGISPNTSYTFYQRYKAKTGYDASPKSASLIVNTDNVSGGDIIVDKNNNNSSTGTGDTDDNRDNNNIRDNNEIDKDPTIERKYTVRFNACGGKNPTTPKKTYTNGTKYGELPTTTKKGYSLKGWYTAKSGGGKISKNSRVALTHDITLYAHWKLKKSYRVLKFNDGVNGIIKTKVQKKKDKVGKLPKAAKKYFYSLKGWYTKKKGGKKITNMSKLKKSATLYAQRYQTSTDKTHEQRYEMDYAKYIQRQRERGDIWFKQQQLAQRLIGQGWPSSKAWDYARKQYPTPPSIPEPDKKDYDRGKY
jgi:uncharacterized repeat protein (TIGR02543 family)